MSRLNAWITKEFGTLRALMFIKGERSGYPRPSFWSMAMDPIMFGGVIIAFVLAVGLVGAATRGPEAPGHLRVVGAVFLLSVVAFCVFGFLASFSMPDAPSVRIIYTLFGVSSLVGAAWLVTPGTASAVSAEPLLCRTRRLS
jgi:hypothetical protein